MYKLDPSVIAVSDKKRVDAVLVVDSWCILFEPHVFARTTRLHVVVLNQHRFDSHAQIFVHLHASADDEEHCYGQGDSLGWIDVMVRMIIVQSPTAALACLFSAAVARAGDPQIATNQQVTSLFLD